MRLVLVVAVLAFAASVVQAQDVVLDRGSDLLFRLVGFGERIELLDASQGDLVLLFRILL